MAGALGAATASVRERQAQFTSFLKAACMAATKAGHKAEVEVFRKAVMSPSDTKLLRFRFVDFEGGTPLSDELYELLARCLLCL